MGDERQEYTVTFLPTGKTSRVRAGTELLKAARKAGLHVNASCGGAGVCGKCRVVVEQGKVLGGKSEKFLPNPLPRDTDRHAAPWSVKMSASVFPRKAVGEKAGWARRFRSAIAPAGMSLIWRNSSRKGLVALCGKGLH